MARCSICCRPAVCSAYAYCQPGTDNKFMIVCHTCFDLLMDAEQKAREEAFEKVFNERHRDYEDAIKEEEMK